MHAARLVIRQTYLNAQWWRVKIPLGLLLLKVWGGGGGGTEAFLKRGEAEFWINLSH